MSTYDDHQTWLLRRAQQSETREEMLLWTAELDGHLSAPLEDEIKPVYADQKMQLRYELGFKDAKTQLLIQKGVRHAVGSTDAHRASTH